MSKTILIAEDESVLSEAMKSRLEAKGYGVIVAADGEEALELFENNEVDIVLLDLVMPKKSGFDVLIELRERDRDFPIIVTSNLGGEADISKAIDLGADQFLVKSNMKLSELINKVVEQLEG